MSASNTGTPLVTNAASIKSVEAADKKGKELARQQKDDMREILNTDAGRRFLWRLLGHCRVNQSVFEPNSRMAYNSGMQDVGHFVLGEIVAAKPEAYLQMMQEHNKEKES